MKSFIDTSKPLIFLCGFFLVTQFMNGVITARIGNSNSFNFGYTLAFYWALGWWFINDSRKHGAPWFNKYMDMGMYLYIAWIFIVPYYLFRTRGWKAIYIIGLLFGIYFGAYIIGALLYLVFSLF